MGKELTGYPSIDKPWMKYYEDKGEKFVEESLYDALCRSVSRNGELVAMKYFGKKFTYDEMLNMVGSIAEFLSSKGVMPKERVIVLGLNTPEIICSVYALNRIGAVACLEYVTQSPDKLADIAKQYGSRHAIILNTFYDKYCSCLMDSGVQSILVANTYDSMPIFLKAIMKSRSKTALVAGSEFLKTSTKVQAESSYEWNHDDPAVVLSTSGTTGTPKRAELSCNALNSLAYQVSFADLGSIRGKTMLTPAPPFYAFGISLTTHMPLVNGMELILSVDPDPDAVLKQFVKYKPNYFISSHVFADRIMESKKVQKMDLSFVSMIMLGGESISAEYHSKVDDFLKQRGCRGFVSTGYGMTELAACSTGEFRNCIRPGSVGIPLKDVVIKACDTTNGQEVRYGETGELLVSSPCMMNGYFKNLEETSKSIEIDSCGKRWIHTGDLGSVDEDGFIHVKGRIKRIDITMDTEKNIAVKLYPDYVESLLLEIDGISACAVITVDHKERNRVPVAFVVVDDVSEDRIRDEMAGKAESYNQPIEYVMMQKLPYLQNGKIDYVSLEKQYNKRHSQQ